jgi:hypothetical protein
VPGRNRIGGIEKTTNRYVKIYYEGRLNQPLERTAHPTRFLGLYPSHQGWAAAHRQRSRESKDFHVKSQTVRFIRTTSYLCGFVPVQKSRLELSCGRGRQPGSSRKGGDGVARP